MVNSTATVENVKVERLTVMFADVIDASAAGSGRGSAPLDRDLSERCAALLGVIRKRFSGKLVRVVGSTVLCSFEAESDAVAAACAMQQAMQGNPLDCDRELGLRIALHTGEATIRNGVCSGEVVTTAARLVPAVGPGRVVVTGVVLTGASAGVRERARHSSDVAAMEKRLQVELHEIDWHDDGAEVVGEGEQQGVAEESASERPEWPSADTTAVPSVAPVPAVERVDSVVGEVPSAGAPRSVEPGAVSNASRLCLVWQGQIVAVDAANVVVHLGREDPNEIVLATDKASRVHAHIECRNDGFYLVDYSTNGTYVYTQEGEEVKVRDGEVRLDFAGAVCPGCPQNSAECEPLMFWTEHG